MLGAFLWRVRPRGEGHPQNVGLDSVIASTFKVSNTKWDWRRLFDATWFQWRKFTLTLHTCWNHFCTFVPKLNKSLTIYLTLRPQNCHVLIQEPTFKTMLQVFQLSRHYNLAYLLNLCESLKLNTWKDTTWRRRRESTRIKMEDTN